jgi:LPXTG-motif cell wall-anchored protein
MKRLTFSVVAICLLIAGAAMAQTANTTAPGPTVQREPGLVSNNLPNPGNPQTDLSNRDTYSQTPATETEEAEGMDVDVDTGAKAEGAVDVDVSSTADTDTDASGIDETGSLDNETTTTTDTGALPDTASELPLLMLAGLLALGSAFMVRLRRNA